MDQSKIGRFIAKRRKELELTQVQLAAKLGVSDKSVSKWERGICLPDVALYQDICKVLGITINEFFAGEEIEKTDVETKSEETIMSIAQDGSNTKKKMMTRLIVLGVITAILAVGIVYALHVLNKKGYTMGNYIRGYSTSAEATTVKELVADPNSHVWFAKYGIDKSFKKCTVIVDRYHFGKLESSEEIGSTQYMEDTDRSGIAAVVFNVERNEYKVAVADGGGMMSFNALSITGEDGAMPEDMMVSSSSMGDDPVKVTKGKAIPIAVCNMGTGDQLAGYSPEYYEEMSEVAPEAINVKEENDYALVIKLRFD